MIHLEAKKLHIIEEVLKIKSDADLDALADFIVNLNKTENIKTGFEEFFGIWSKEEAEEIERLITD